MGNVAGVRHRVAGLEDYDLLADRESHGTFLHLHEFRRDGLQALELFFEVLTADGTAPAPRLGHDPEHAAGAQLLAALAWHTPRQLLALPPAQVHPVLRGLLSVDDLFVPQLHFGG